MAADLDMAKRSVVQSPNAFTASSLRFMQKLVSINVGLLVSKSQRNMIVIFTVF